MFCLQVMEVEAFCGVHDMIHAAILSHGSQASLREVINPTKDALPHTRSSCPETKGCDTRHPCKRGNHQSDMSSPTRRLVHLGAFCKGLH